nr:hypothetical protein [Saprospiraceae bacterium]
IQFLINQKPEFQSYTAVKELYQLLANKSAPTISSPIRIPVEIVVAENVDFYAAKNRFAT